MLKHKGDIGEGDSLQQGALRREGQGELQVSAGVTLSFLPGLARRGPSWAEVPTPSCGHLFKLDGFPTSCFFDYMAIHPRSRFCLSLLVDVDPLGQRRGLIPEVLGPGSLAGPAGVQQVWVGGTAGQRRAGRQSISGFTRSGQALIPGFATRWQCGPGHRPPSRDLVSGSPQPRLPTPVVSLCVSDCPLQGPLLTPASGQGMSEVEGTRRGFQHNPILYRPGGSWGLLCPVPFLPQRGDPPGGGTEGLSSQGADPFVLLEVPGGVLTGAQPLGLMGAKAGMSPGYFRSNNYQLGLPLGALHPAPPRHLSKHTLHNCSRFF